MTSVADAAVLDEVAHAYVWAAIGLARGGDHSGEGEAYERAALAYDRLGWPAQAGAARSASRSARAQGRGRR